MGGAIFNNGGTVNIFNSTLTANTATGGAGGSSVSGRAGDPGQGLGGAIFNRNGTVTLFNATIAFNTATTGGGAAGSGTAGGVYNLADGAGTSAIVNLTNTIVSNSTATGDFTNNRNGMVGTATVIASAPVNTNIVQSNVSNLNGATVTGTINATNPNVVALADNGGITRTVALTAASAAAIDRGTNVGVAANEQRGPGFNRTINLVTDIGAYEYQPPATVTTVVSSQDPSGAGVPVQFTATVVGTAPGSNLANAGTVTFLFDGVALGVPVAVVNGVATSVFTLSAQMTLSAHPVVATYSGSTVGSYTFAGSVGNMTQDVVASATTTTVVSSLNPSPLGTVVSFTATVTPSTVGPFSAAGTVTFTFDGVVVGGPVALVGGSATSSFTIPGQMSGGAHTVVATFTSSNLFFTGSAGTLTQTVDPAVTVTTVATSASSIFFGQQVTFTATVLPTSIPPFTAGGTITFFVDGVAQATVAMVGGSASFTIGTLSVGTHTVVAQYNGDGNFAPSSGAVTQVVTGPVGSYAVGADAGGGPQVNVYAADGQLKFGFFAFDPGFRGGVRVAMADFNFDGVLDIVTGAGPGGGPQVRVFDGATGNPLPGILGSFFGLTPASFSGGVFVAAGDVNGDGAPDVIVSADAGGGPQVNVFSGRDGSILLTFNALAPGFSGGVRVASADVNRDGFADIITAAGPGGLAQVTTYSGNGLGVLSSFFALPGFYSGGLYIAAGDLNLDGQPDIVVGAGRGGITQVTVFNGLTAQVQGAFFASPSLVQAGDASAIAGIRVGVTTFSGRPSILLGSGVGVSPIVNVIDGTTYALLNAFFAYDPSFRSGLFVTGG